MNIDLTKIALVFIDLLAALITWKLIPWIKAHTTQAQQKNLEAVYRVLVFAAEQIYGAGHGEDKFKYVKNELARRGFDVDAAQIEAAVSQYLNHQPELVLEAADDDEN